MSISSQAAVGVVGQILAGLDRAYTGFGEVVDSVVQGASTAKQQLTDLKKFDFDPAFRTRVISIPAAIDGFQDLFDTIKNGLVDKFNTLSHEMTDLLASIKSIPPRAPGEPILQRTALVLEFIHATNTEIAQIMTSLLDFTQTIDDIKNRIETLDDLFLPQNSKRTEVSVSYSKRNA